MFKPQGMSRTVIIGSKDNLEEAIEALYRLKVAHIKDFTDGIEGSTLGLKLGRPLEQAYILPKQLLKLRSVSSLLEIKDQETEEKFNDNTLSKKINQELDELERRVSEVMERKNEITATLEKTKQTLEDIQPLRVLPPNLRLDYKVLAVFVGYEKKEIETSLKRITKDYELYSEKYEKRNLVAIFVPKNFEKKVYGLLNEAKFEFFDIPEIEGSIGSFYNKLDGHQQKLEKEMEQINRELEDIKKEYAAFILASEEQMSIEIDKAEAPLRFATTEHLFIIDCWIPSERFEDVERTLKAELQGDILIQTLEEGEEAPIILDNPKPMKSFEYLLSLFSIPKWGEIDPTVALSLVFPIFFGLMIGDLGYGILIIIIGLYLRKRYIFGIGGGGVGNVLVIAGIFSSFFGLVVFAEAFGIPFAGANHETWSSILGIEIPYHAMIHKLETMGVINLLVIAVVAAFIHLGIGFIFGFVNNIKHNKKHAIAKIGWLLVLFAIFLLLMLMAEGTDVGSWVCKDILFSIQSYNMEIAGLLVPIPTIGLLIVGVVILILFEGGMAVMEVVSLMTNILSYTRLTAVGVAKAAVALAFNSMTLPLILSGKADNIIIGLLVWVGLHAMILIIGMLSAGVQAIRLNYVEFFLKFYKGGGIKYKPFGRRRKYTTES